MPLIEHLLELRRRLMWAALAVLAGAVAGWFVSEWVLTLLSEPLCVLGTSTAVVGTSSTMNAPP